MQCHFTWALDLSPPPFPQLRQNLEDINPREQSPYLGCFHNLLGFINFQLNAHNDALRSFETAAEAFRGAAADEGPCLLVTYRNLAWLHHHLGNEEESQKYLTRVRNLMETHPPPFQDELHPEVYAEKAWTLMSISINNPLVGEYFRRATEGRPDMVAWNSSYVIWLIKSLGYKLEEEVMETLRSAIERDPENTYLAVQQLNQRVRIGEDVGEEARRLADRIMDSPVGQYTGMETLLWLFTQHISADEGMNVAEQLLERYPDQYYAKKCAAQCYQWSLFSKRFTFPNETLETIRNRAIALYQGLIQKNPQISTPKVHLADIYAPVDLQRAEQLYREVLHNHNPDLRQLIYHKYARFLFHRRHDGRGSARYHMEVLNIPKQSRYRLNSYKILVQLREQNLFLDLGLERFLSTVPPPEDTPPV